MVLRKPHRGPDIRTRYAITMVDQTTKITLHSDFRSQVSVATVTMKSCNQNRVTSNRLEILMVTAAAVCVSGLITIAHLSVPSPFHYFNF